MSSKRPQRAVPGMAPAGFILAALLCAAPMAPAAPAVLEPWNLRTAESLLVQPPSKERDKALAKWAEGRASLSDLVFVLRRPPEQLGSLEPKLLAAALGRVPAGREALRARLLHRQRLVDPKAKATAVAPPPVALRPRATVFRVAAIAPDSGDYREYGASLIAGIRAGLEGPVLAEGFPIELEVGATGNAPPDRVLASLDRFPDAGVVIGELLSVPTLVLAAALRDAGIPLISPTATNEDVGLISPRVFQIGPSGHLRGASLARATVTGGTPRVGLLVSTAVEGSSFATGFAAVAESLGATVAVRETYAAGSLNFHDEVKAILAARLDLVFWDGEAREAEALLRQLARDRASVRLCGGPGLAPDLHHADTRTLLEGVQYVSEEWSLGDAQRAGMDSTARAAADDPVRLRGWLAGRLARAAVAGGALCPEEITAYLAGRRLRGARLESHGFLDLAAEGVSVPVYAVRRGRGVRL